MSKKTQIKLGIRPKDFPKEITFPMLDGTTGAFEVTCIYRTREEFGAMADAIMAEAQAKMNEERARITKDAEDAQKRIDELAQPVAEETPGDAPDAQPAAVPETSADGLELFVAGAPYSMGVMLAETTRKTAEHVMKLITGWNLDVPFDLESVITLGSTYPAALPAILEGYRVAIVDGRLGN